MRAYKGVIVLECGLAQCERGQVAGGDVVASCAGCPECTAWVVGLDGQKLTSVRRQEDTANTDVERPAARKRSRR